MKKEYIRWFKSLVENAVKARRVVIISGARQCGKTTLSKQIKLKKDSIYRTLDDSTLLRAAMDDPTGFVRHDSSVTMIIDEIQKAFTDISLSTIISGGQGGVSATQGQVNALAPGGNTNALQQKIATSLAEAATGASNILSRQFGAVANPNLELLFNGPSLRSFTFNFRFTPRESKEAEEVRKIIRYFKQAMSVKRSKSSLLLRAPHTFAISYLSKKNIDTRPVFPSISQYEIWGYRAETPLNSKFIGDNGINLPSGVNLSIKSVEKVAKEIRRILV
jgi:hypothetical protein